MESSSTVRDFAQIINLITDRRNELHSMLSNVGTDKRDGAVNHLIQNTGLVIPLNRAREIWTSCFSKFVELNKELGTTAFTVTKKHKAIITETAFWNKIKTILSKWLIIPLHVAENNLLPKHNRDQIENQNNDLADIVSKQMKKTLAKLDDNKKFSVHSGQYLVQSLLSFFDILNQTPNHVQRDFELKQKRSLGFVCKSGDDDDDDDDDEEVAGQKCNYHLPNTNMPIKTIILDYRIKSLLELVVSPDILMEWKMACAKTLYSNNMDKQYEIFVEKLSEDIKGKELTLIPFSSQKFNNIKNLACPSSVKRVIFDSCPPHSFDDYFIGTPLEYSQNPQSSICSLKICPCVKKVDVAAAAAAIRVARKQLISFFDRSQTHAPIFSRLTNMLIAYMKPVTLKDITLQYLDTIWSAIPNEIAAWEDIFHTAIEDKAKGTTFLNTSSRNSVNCLTFIPLKNMDLLKRRVFDLNDVSNTHAPTSAEMELMVKRRIKNFHQILYWDENTNLKPSVGVPAKAAQDFVDKSCFFRSM